MTKRKCVKCEVSYLPEVMDAERPGLCRYCADDERTAEKYYAQRPDLEPKRRCLSSCKSAAPCGQYTGKVQYRLYGV
jgi:hypothetical protein